MSGICSKCGSALGPYDAALTRKLISRISRECLCLKCLAEFFHVSTDLLEERILFFRESGCTMF
ncbi:MAG: hypothetical protein LBD16_06615 [Oscillospiraceae bacterium]|jgi:hypothetical protein|nr:hypothetical protein [Oscillospiraceae bacterium]